MLPFLIMLEEQSTGFLAPLLLNLVPPNSYTFDLLGLERKTMFCFKHSYGALHTALNAVPPCLTAWLQARLDEPERFPRPIFAKAAELAVSFRSLPCSLT